MEENDNQGIEKQNVEEWANTLQLPKVGEQLWDSGAQAHIIVTQEDQQEAIGLIKICMVGAFTQAFALARLYEKRFYRTVGFESMEALFRWMGLSHHMGWKYVGIGKCYEERQLIGENGKREPLGMLGPVKLDVLRRGLTAEQFKKLTEDGEYMGPDGSFYTIDDLLMTKIPDLRDQLKKARRRMTDMEESLKTTQAERDQLMAERAQGDVAKNLAAEVENLQFQNYELTMRHKRNEEGIQEVHILSDEIMAAIKKLDAYQYFTNWDYEGFPVLYETVAGICNNAIGKLRQIQMRIERTSQEVENKLNP